MGKKKTFSMYSTHVYKVLNSGIRDTVMATHSPNWQWVCSQSHWETREGTQPPHDVLEKKYLHCFRLIDLKRPKGGFSEKTSKLRREGGDALSQWQVHISSTAKSLCECLWKPLHAGMYIKVCRGITE